MCNREGLADFLEVNCESVLKEEKSKKDQKESLDWHVLICSK